VSRAKAVGEDSASRVRWLLIQAAFVLSGACALGYEILWGRWLATVLGSSALAIAVVLASYMGGQALGAWGAGQLSSRLMRPLRTYVGVEVGLGLFALLFPSLVSGVLGLPGELRVGLAVALLFVPTVLLGATVPLVLAWSERALLPAGATLARLYGLNTLGAFVGCVAAGFWLIPELGLRATNALAAGGNFTIAAAIGWLAWKLPEPAGRPLPAEDGSAASGERVPLWLLNTLAALSGFATLGLEVVWIRLLRITLSSTTYTFTLVISTFILGIGLGGLVAGRVRENAPVLPRLTLAQLLLCALVLAVWFLLPAASAREVLGTDADFAGALVATIALCATFLLAPTLVMGFLFPMLGRLYMQDGARGERIGQLYAFNTLGAVAGSIGTTVVLIPRIGSSASYLLLLGFMVVAALAYASLASGLSWARAGAGALALAVAGLALFHPGWPVSYLGIGGHRSVIGENHEVLFFAEGASSTVLVEESYGHRGLRIDGKSVASTIPPDLANQLLLGHLPALLTDRVDSGLVVGLGTGITLESLGRHELERLDLVELEPRVQEGARYFDAWNGKVLERPELRVIIDDGYNYLHSADAHYDVVTSDPIQPFFRGAATLYSREFFELGRERLTERGVFAHWLPLANLSAEDLRMIARSFIDAFPYARLYWNGAFGAVLVGRRVPWESPSIDGPGYARAAADLGRVYIDSREELEALLLADRAALAAWAGEGERNRVDLPLLEFSSPRSLFARTIEANLRELLAARDTMDRQGDAWQAIRDLLVLRTTTMMRGDPAATHRALLEALGCSRGRPPCSRVDASGSLRREGWMSAMRQAALPLEPLFAQQYAGEAFELPSPQEQRRILDTLLLAQHLSAPLRPEEAQETRTWLAAFADLLPDDSPLLPRARP